MDMCFSPTMFNFMGTEAKLWRNESNQDCSFNKYDKVGEGQRSRGCMQDSDYNDRPWNLTW